MLEYPHPIPGLGPAGDSGSIRMLATGKAWVQRARRHDTADSPPPPPPGAYPPTVAWSRKERPQLSAAVARARGANGAVDWARVAKAFDWRHTPADCRHEFLAQQRSARTTTRWAWTPKRLRQLELAVQDLGVRSSRQEHGRWADVAARVDHRVPVVECIRQWIHQKETSTAIVPWEPSEDALLQQLVEEAFGRVAPGNVPSPLEAAQRIDWPRIAAQLHPTGRSAKEAWRRWRTEVDPNVVKERAKPGPSDEPYNAEPAVLYRATSHVWASDPEEGLLIMFPRHLPRLSQRQDPTGQDPFPCNPPDLVAQAIPNRLAWTRSWAEQGSTAVVAAAHDRLMRGTPEHREGLRVALRQGTQGLCGLAAALTRMLPRQPNDADAALRGVYLPAAGTQRRRLVDALRETPESQLEQTEQPPTKKQRRR